VLSRDLKAMNYIASLRDDFNEISFFDAQINLPAYGLPGHGRFEPGNPRPPAPPRS
jgi:hypothetical protein